MGTFDRFAPATISAYRVVVGLLFVCHGAASLFGVLGGAFGSGGSVPVGTWPGWWAALIQLVGGLLVMIGLLTRPAALLCSGSMAYAYFMVHQEKGALPIQNGGEAAAMFCWAFLLIAIVGPGPFSVDELVTRRLGRAERTPAGALGGTPGRPVPAMDRTEPAPAAELP